MSIDRNYIRQELKRNTPASAQKTQEIPYQFSVENYIKQGISSQQVEHLLTRDHNGLKNWLIHVLFAHKEVLKRIPGLGNYLIHHKDQMLREELQAMSHRSMIDLTDIIGWYRDDFIGACYLRLLGRHPDPQGFGTYLDLSRHGAENQVIAYAIVQSPEFGNRAEVAHLQEYRKAYQSFMRKQKLLHIPILGRVIYLFLLSGQIERLYARLERTESVCQQELQHLQYQTAEGMRILTETQGLVTGIQQGLMQQQKFVLDIQTQQQKQFAVMQQFLEKQQKQFAAVQNTLGDQQKQYLAMHQVLGDQQSKLLQYAQEQIEFSQRILQTIGEQSIYWQSTPAKIDDQSVLIGSLSQKLDSQASVVGKISGQMDEIPLALQAANKTSHSTVFGMPGGVIGVINDDFIFGVPSEEWGVAMYLSAVDTFEHGSEYFFQNQLKPGYTVLDIGANMGIYSLRALRQGCHVYAFEPTPKICNILKQNIKVNGFAESKRAHVIQKAVSNVCGTATFYQNTAMSGHSSLYCDEMDREIQEIVVETVALDSCRSQFGSVDFIKIDVEGAEYFAFCGMRQLLMENHNVKLIMEFAPAHMKRAGVEPEQMLLLIQELGFTTYQINETTAEAEPVEQSKLLQEESVNLYLVRES